jgi:isoleucyl-tRNA synthetase
MSLVRRLVTLGRSARTEAKTRVRQPLRRALVVLPAAEAEDLAALKELVAEELNVKEVEIGKGMEELVSYSVRPNFARLGPRFGPLVKDVARALAQADAQELVAALENDGAVVVDLNGEKETLEREDLDVRVEGREGFSLAQDGPYGVALDLELTPELRAEGAAREVVRAVQDLRKSSGLAVEDRIELWLDSPEPKIASALEKHRDYIASEVLATTTNAGPAPDGVAADEVRLDEGPVTVGLRKA